MADFPVSRTNLEKRVRRLLGDAPQQTTLAVSCDGSETTLSLSSVEEVHKDAKIEIGQEAMLVTSDPDGNDVTVVRGYGGTIAAAHTLGDVGFINPDYLKSNIVEALNVVLGNWISRYMPRFVWDSSTGGTFEYNAWVYPVTADAFRVRRVCWQVPGYTELHDVSHGPLQPYPTSLVSTGVGVPVYSDKKISWGQTLHVLTEQSWPLLETDEAEVPADFPAMADELIVTGAALYLLGWRVVPRFTLDESVFARDAGESVPQNFNISLLERMKRDWIEGMHAILSHRPTPPEPSKVWIA